MNRRGLFQTIAAAVLAPFAAEGPSLKTFFGSAAAAKRSVFPGMQIRNGIITRSDGFHLKSLTKKDISAGTIGIEEQLS